MIQSHLSRKHYRESAIRLLRGLASTFALQLRDESRSIQERAKAIGVDVAEGSPASDKIGALMGEAQAVMSEAQRIIARVESFFDASDAQGATLDAGKISYMVRVLMTGAVLPLDADETFIADVEWIRGRYEVLKMKVFNFHDASLLAREDWVNWFLAGRPDAEVSEYHG